MSPRSPLPRGRVDAPSELLERTRLEGWGECQVELEQVGLVEADAERGRVLVHVGPRPGLGNRAEEWLPEPPGQGDLSRRDLVPFRQPAHRRMGQEAALLDRRV